MRRTPASRERETLWVHSIRQIPLSKLVASAANVRRTGRTSNIGELAASIAAHGLLQNLNVRAVLNGRKKPEAFEVIAGGRRLAALKALAKRKALPENANIPCKVLVDGIAEEISLAENVGQLPRCTPPISTRRSPSCMPSMA